MVVPYPLNWSHGTEGCSSRKGVLVLPVLRPLSLMCLYSLFKRAIIVAGSVGSDTSALPLLVRRVRVWRAYLTSCFRFSSSPNNAHKNCSTRSPGTVSTTSRSSSWGPKFARLFGRASVKRARNMMMN